ncbi:hypothetical protein FMM05_05585 [Flavobacterium zepuense]|uniref:Uncharacterized protein n=1 Tax=Flavobacterium zepuense TaxID=2593302 RepID=A0A552V5D8_9FLAO|nr:hypothetical protein [Flavobacterium zepuense]TRW25693.1 hypothetical protein FMM05_05585 [Flavobacterium zepuense]
MKNILLLCLLLVGTHTALAQKTFNSKAYGFSILKPERWIEITSESIQKNLEKAGAGQKKLDELLKQEKNGVLVTSYYKYPIKAHKGIIPTVKVTLRTNPFTNFEAFKAAVTNTSDLKKMFPDLEIIDAPQVVTVGGVKGLYFSCKFTLDLKNGTVMKIRSRSYSLPYKNKFYQINLQDGQTEEDCTALFNALIKSIKIGF